MKTLWRTVIILFAAFIVIGATVALANSGLLANFGNRFPGDRDGFGERGFPPEDFQPGNFQPRGDGNGFPGDGFRPDRGAEGGGRGFFFFSWLRNLGIIAAIVVVVVLIERLIPRKRRQLAATEAPSIPDELITPTNTDTSTTDENP